MIKHQQQQQQVFVEENMSNLTSAASGEASGSSGNNRVDPLPSPSTTIYPPSHQQFNFPHEYSQLSQDEQPPTKKKRNLPGNPDPEAEVIALSPKSLLATNRFLCEICNKGFQRDQNLQLHRRGHNLPWKLKQRTNKEVRKKVYVCPDTSCVHHDPSRALGDLTGIKKHFCRKHGEKKWKCDKCSKRYAVQSDWKAHSKVCGTREYRCDCGTLFFSRRDSFITHRAFCDALAEETARAIPANPLLANPIVSSSHSHFMNLQHQHHQQQQQEQLMNSQQQHDQQLHTFQVKREQLQHPNFVNLPPWLACPPMDHHSHHDHLVSPSSSSSSIFHQDHQQKQLMQQQFADHQQQQRQQGVHMQGQNFSNHNIGPTFTGGAPTLNGPYQTQGSPASPHMSATALLQKASQMGATMSQHQHQGHVSDTATNATTTTMTSTAGLFGLNLSSRDQGLSSFEHNKTATPTTTGGSDHLTSPNLNPTPGPDPSTASILHGMMVNSLPSTYDNGHAFGIEEMGMLSSTISKKHNSMEAFQHPLGGQDEGHQHRNGGVGGGEELTRDFLGLRPLSHSEILTMAGLGNCMNSNNATSRHQQQEENSHETWQGN